MSFNRGPLSAALVLTVAFLNTDLAWADRSGTVTLKTFTSLNLETGAISPSSGDILWDGNALVPQGAAELYNLGRHGSRIFRSIRSRSAASVIYRADPIPASDLVAGDIFGVHTRAGHYAKVMVTAVDGSTLSLEFTAFTSAAPETATQSATQPAASASGPLITSIQNNYSNIIAGQPNYGIAPGTIFAIYGTNLSTSAPPVLQSSAPPGLPTTLNQTSVSLTVKGVTVSPGLYFTPPRQ